MSTSAAILGIVAAIMPVIAAIIEAILRRKSKEEDLHERMARHSIDELHAVDGVQHVQEGEPTMPSERREDQ